jgi:wobble nucleotide-excising tRNase
MLQKILDGLEESYPLLILFVALLCTLIYLMYLIIKSNIENVKTDLMNSINTVKIEMIQNAKDIKVGVDKDVVTLRADQDHTSQQLKQVEFNIHAMNKNMVNMQHEVRTMNSTMDKVNHTLTLMHIQMGGDLKQAIKGSIDNLED